MRKNIGPQKLLSSDVFSVSSLLVPNSLVAHSLMHCWSTYVFSHTAFFSYNVSKEESIRIRAVQQNGRDPEICF